MSDTIEVLNHLRRDCDEASAVAVQRGSDARPAATSPTLDFLANDELRGTMTRRRSMRFFDDEPVDAHLITTMIHSAQEADAALWPTAAAASPLEFYLAAGNVTGVARAIHVFRGGGFEVVAHIPEATGLSDMVLQPEFGFAPALILVIGSLERALADHGSHGHRILLERSGAACAAAWLAAVHRGRGGSIFAGFLPSALKQLVHIDGFRRTQLLALAVGQPAQMSVPDHGMGPS